MTRAILPNTAMLLILLTRQVAATEPVATLTAHDDRIQVIAFSCDGTLLVTSGRDGQANIWRGEDFSRRGSLTGIRALSYIPPTAVSRNGGLIALGGPDKHDITVWKTSNLTVQATLALHGDTVTSAVFAGDGSTLVTGTRDRTLRIWSTKDGKQLHRLNLGFKVDHVVTSADGKTLAASGHAFDDPWGYGFLGAWEMGTWRLVTPAEFDKAPHFGEGRTAPVFTLGAVSNPVFSADGKFLFSVQTHEDSTQFCKLAIDDWRVMESHKVTQGVSDASLAVSPDETIFVVGGSWKPTPHDEVMKPRGSLQNVTPSPFRRIGRAEQKRNAVLKSIPPEACDESARDQDAAEKKPRPEHRSEARLFAVDTGKYLGSIENYYPLGSGLAFSPDGLHLAVSCSDNTVKIWRVKDLIVSKNP